MGFPRKKKDKSPGLVNGDAGHPVPLIAPVTPFLGPIYRIQKEYTVYSPERQVLHFHDGVNHVVGKRA